MQHEAKRKKFQNQDSVISEKFASKVRILLFCTNSSRCSSIVLIQDETLDAQDGWSVCVSTRAATDLILSQESVSIYHIYHIYLGFNARVTNIPIPPPLGHKEFDIYLQFKWLYIIKTFYILVLSLKCKHRLLCLLSIVCALSKCFKSGFWQCK